MFICVAKFYKKLVVFLRITTSSTMLIFAVILKNRGMGGGGKINVKIKQNKIFQLADPTLLG